MKITRREFLQKSLALGAAATVTAAFPSNLFSATKNVTIIKTIEGFKCPYGLSLDANGLIWITDAAGYCVHVFDRAGKKVGQFGKPGASGDQFNYPQGIFVDGDDVYVMDSNNGRIVIFSSNFKLKSSIGTIGGYPEAFYTPKGLFVGDRIYACNTRNHFISVFDKSSHKLLQKWGDLGDDPLDLASGSRDYKFRLPTDVAVDSDGRVYVVDSKHGQIKVLDSSGKFLFKFGELGSEPGQLNFPEGIALDSENNVYVCDALNARIQKFDQQGKLLGIFQNGLSKPTSLAIDETNQLYIVDANLKKVFIAKWD